jgi:hypothetical protein
LKAARLGGGDVERSLEFGVENIEKTVGETPQEEENGDEGDGKDGLLDGKSRSAGKALVDHALALLVGHGVRVGRCSLNLVGHGEALVSGLR